MAIRRQKRAITLEYGRLSGARWDAWLQSPEGAENRLKALRLCIEDSKRYLSFSDTKTLCRSCAAREDHRHIRRSERDAVARKEAELLWPEFDSLERFVDGSDAEGI
jgi:hypothetical protein